MKSKIAIINGHPYSESLCAGLAAAYEKGAIASGAQVRNIDLSRMNFDPNLKYGYSRRMELENDLLDAQETIRWADHLVLVYPIWWGTMPAVMKGFFDRTFLPGFAYRYRPNSAFWDKLLSGRSARLIVTMDFPSWYNRLVYKQAGHHIMKRSILNFSGINPVRITEIGPVKGSKEQTREKWLAKVEALGSKMA